MRRIVYYVATSLDGFICGPHDDSSRFVGEGNGVARYLADLADYDTVIMGKNTYEFGYKFGLKPGQRAYPHMTHYIFSNSLKLENPDARVNVYSPELERIKKLKAETGTDIYLCGGGVFTGWLLDNDLIDVLKIKLNPILLGNGVRLFGDSRKDLNLELIDTNKFDHGLQIMTYHIGRHN